MIVRRTFAQFPPVRVARTAALLIAVASLGCSEPTRPSPTRSFGIVTGVWDGQPWKGMGHAVIQNGALQIVGQWQDPRYHYDEWVIVSTAFSGEGEYQIDVTRGLLLKLTGGDAGSIDDASGALNITEYDAASRRMRGTLTLASPDPRYPARFDDGRFDVVVYHRSEDVPRLPCRWIIGCVD